MIFGTDKGLLLDDAIYGILPWRILGTTIKFHVNFQSKDYKQSYLSVLVGQLSGLCQDGIKGFFYGIGATHCQVVLFYIA